MAVNTLIDNNFLIVDEGSSNQQYFNAGWTTMEFTDVAVILTDLGRMGNVGKSVTIAFTDFQYDSVAKSTESDIFDILKDKIG